MSQSSTVNRRCFVADLNAVQNILLYFRTEIFNGLSLSRIVDHSSQLHEETGQDKHLTSGSIQCSLANTRIDKVFQTNLVWTRLKAGVDISWRDEIAAGITVEANHVCTGPSIPMIHYTQRTRPSSSAALQGHLHPFQNPNPCNLSHWDHLDMVYRYSLCLLWRISRRHPGKSPLLGCRKSLSKLVKMVSI